MENGHLERIFPQKMVIFYSYVELPGGMGAYGYSCCVYLFFAIYLDICDNHTYVLCIIYIYTYLYIYIHIYIYIYIHIHIPLYTSNINGHATGTEEDSRYYYHMRGLCFQAMQGDVPTKYGQTYSTNVPPFQDPENPIDVWSSIIMIDVYAL